MAIKKTEKPNVILAKVTGTYYDFPDALYSVYLANKKTYKTMNTVYVGEDMMPALLKVGSTLVVWVSTDFEYKYLAFGDRIIEPRYKEKSVLSAATQKHFDDYKQKSNARLNMKKNITEIEQKIAVIKLINTESDADIAKAKRKLLEFLNNRVVKIRNDLGKKK